MTARLWVGAALLAACAGSSGRSAVSPAAFFRPEDRVLISDFSHIQAVAASPWMVFAATPHGLLIYDRIARRFNPPVTALEGYPAGRVISAAVDAAGNAVWLELWGGGNYVRYDVDGRTWTPGHVTSDQLAGVLTVEDALAQAPLADAMRAAILTDTRLRSHRFTAAAATPERAEVFFGTDGMGLVRVDRQTGEWDVLTYGLIASGVGAIAPAPDGVWAAASTRPGRAERRGITWVAGDLSTTRTEEGGGAALGFRFQSARRLLTIGRDLWLATELGVLRIDPSSWRFRLFDLPDATSLARAPDGVWVGTARGLSLITSDERVVAMEPRGLPVTSLLAVRDTLWVGTTAGLGHLVPGAPAVAVRTGVTVRAIAALHDTIVIAGDRELMWRRGADTGDWTSVALPLSLGIPLVLAPAPDGGLWIGGTHGLAFAELFPTPLVSVLPAPTVVPAAVRDLALDGDYLWAATDSGLVRFDRRALRN
jgi:hypothetical protein